MNCVLLFPWAPALSVAAQEWPSHRRFRGADACIIPTMQRRSGFPLDPRRTGGARNELARDLGRKGAMVSHPSAALDRNTEPAVHEGAKRFAYLLIRGMPLAASE